MSGPRRLSQREARLGGAKGQRDHRNRHGDGKTAADLMPEDHLDEEAPPAFLDAAGKRAWRRVITAAPPDLLHTIDTDLVAAVAAAMVPHENAVKLSQRAWQDLDTLRRTSLSSEMRCALRARLLNWRPHWVYRRSPDHGSRCRLLNPPFPTTRICALSNSSGRTANAAAPSQPDQRLCDGRSSS